MTAKRFAACVLSLGISLCAVTSTAQSQSASIAIPGHVLPALVGAVKLAPSAQTSAESDNETLGLTIVLRRTDPDGFAQYLQDVYDAKSGRYLQFLSPLAVSEQFGPTAADLAAVRAYFEPQGFHVIEASDNRMTLTLTATRAVAQRALSVNIRDYRLGDRSFYANDAEPVLPAQIAPKVEAIIGLSNLAQPTTNNAAIKKVLDNAFYQLCLAFETAQVPAPGSTANTPPASQCTKPASVSAAKLWTSVRSQPITSGTVPWSTVRGTGQKIGLLEFDTFVQSDVADFLNLFGFPASAINNLSQVHVNGGATLGARQDEVLLDITQVMRLASGAQVVVFDAPFTGGGASFQSLFNSMVNNHVTVISNSWSYCEDQTSLADVQSIDTILQTAAASGISVFNASGDTGSTCLDGGANTVGVPASSPHGTAVGATTLTVGPGSTYISEHWWNGSADTPPTGMGGFGVSKFFARPSYQDGFTASANRSVPDVVANGDPAKGVVICQASAGGCPTGLFYGGTSVAAPTWAAFAAILNQAQGHNLGSLNPQIYPLAATAAFHGPASMGSDFAHVGLGSANLNLVDLALAGQTAGVPDVTQSSLVPYAFGPVPIGGVLGDNPTADGSSSLYVVVWLRDANGNMVSGKTVTLAKSAGSSAVISPASGVTSASNGAVVFTVSNAVAENVTFTAADTTDGVLLDPQSVTFDAPPAASAGITANPTSVANDGVAATTITVTLQDAHGNPTPGKLISLAQAGGHSVISGPTPSVTDATGKIQFTATDLAPETVSYSALDVTDGNLPVPAPVAVTFGGQADGSCVSQTPLTPASGFTLTTFITGFAASNVFYGNVNWSCRGASNPAFTSDGSVYANNFPDGGVYKLNAQGGAVTSGNKLSTLGPTLFGPVVGKDGRMYAARGATTGDFSTGAIFELDPATGAIVRTVVGGVTCPTGLAVDPLSGDLFVSDSCAGAGSDNPSLWRVANPASATPTLSVYTTLPTTPTGWIAIAPDGTIFMPQNLLTGTEPVLRISGTNIPGPPTQTPVPGLTTLYWVTVGETNPDGSAKSLIVLDGPSSHLKLANISTNPPTFTDLIDAPVGSGVVGPDGCLYVSNTDAIYKLAPSAGSCGFTPTSHPPGLTLSPASASPAQGATQTLVATFVNATVPAGTGVSFSIKGANQQTRSALTDATGNATMSYQGLSTGTDQVIASATVGGSTLTTNQASVDWTLAGGKHVSFVSLNGTQQAGTTGATGSFSAALFDASVDPNAPIDAAMLGFSLNGQTCSASTDPSGIATCSIALPSAAGTYPLQVNYAGNAANTPATATQSVVVTAPVGGPTPAGVVSRKVHGAAGTFDLPLSLVATNPTTEPRQGPSHTVVFTFANPVTSATASITEGVATTSAPTFSGNDVIVGLTGVNNRQYVTIALTNVSFVGGGTGGSGSVRVGFLVGDVNLNRVVTVSDLLLVNQQIAHVVTSANFLKDVNANGILTVSDKLIINNNVTKALPAP